MKRYGIGLLLMLMISWAIGCSGTSEPITPGTKTADLGNAEIPLMVSDFNADGSPAGGAGPIGIFSVHIDTDTLNYEMTPVRTGASKDGLEVLDVTNFMNSWPCRDCATLKQVGITGWDELNLLFGIRHPFPAPKFSEPISGLNRADVHLFNVEGMLVFNDSNIKNFSYLNEKVSIPPRLTNADGYSSYLDSSLDAAILNTPASIHPYKTFFVNYANGNFDPTSPYGFTSLLNPTGFMVMKQGSNIDQREYFVRFNPGEDLDFLFVVQASWGVSSEDRNHRLTPVYQCPQFNKKAASYVEVEVTSNNLIENDITSSALMKIKFLDINYNAPVGTGLGDIRQQSKVEKIVVEISDIMLDNIVLNNPVPAGGDPRNEANPAYVEVEIKNTAAVTAGDYLGLVKVLDTYDPGQNVNPLLDTKDGGAKVPVGTNPVTNLFAIPEFATYQTFMLHVGTLFINHPPVAVLHTIPRSDCGFLPRDVEVTIDATDSYDPDHGLGPCGDIISYEFDFEWDGNPFNFSADVTGINATANHTYTTSGPTVIGVRVIDGCMPPLQGLTPWNVTIGNPDIFRSNQTMVSFGMVKPTLDIQPIINTTPMVVHGSDVYIAWTAKYQDKDYVYSARSGDGGCTWGPFARIYTMEEKCWLNNVVFVALDVLANGDPILVVISPKTVVCNAQSWWFHGLNIGENEVDWGWQHASTLYQIDTAFIDMMGHPTDPNRAYICVWNKEITPPQLMLIEVNGAMGPGEPTFPHLEVDLGPSFVIYDLDMAVERDSDLHIVWETSNQIKYIQVDPDRPPAVSPQVVVSRPGDVNPSNPRIDLTNPGVPYVVYSAENTGTADIYLQIGTGDPITFPNPSLLVNSVTDFAQKNPDIRLNQSTGDIWVVFQSYISNDASEILFERYTSALTRITPINNSVNTDDPINSHDDNDPSIAFNPAQNAMNVVWIEGANSMFEPNLSFNRTN